MSAICDRARGKPVEASSTTGPAAPGAPGAAESGGAGAGGAGAEGGAAAGGAAAPAPVVANRTFRPEEIEAMVSQNTVNARVAQVLSLAKEAAEKRNAAVWAS